VVQDLVALGQSLKTTYLEIFAPDGVITQYVISSLISMGWLIRVSGTSLCPVREVDPLDSKKYKSNKGIYTFFDFDSHYIKYVGVKEEAPKVANDKVEFSTSITKIVNLSFTTVYSGTAIPFTYCYLHPDMERIEDTYPGCTLFPTAHAHSGQVLVVKAPLKVKYKLIDLGDYYKRVSAANTFKSLYVYTRIAYYPFDKFAHRTSFFLRNRIFKDEVKAEELMEDNDINFDRVFAIKSSIPVLSWFKLNPVVERNLEVTQEMSRLYSEKKKILLNLVLSLTKLSMIGQLMLSL